jgi:hypothetical protein
VACDLTRVTGDCDVGQRKFGSSCGVDIEADHAPSTIDEIAGDRASYDAQPDDPTVLFLRVRSQLSNSIDGQRQPRLN